MGTNSRGKRSLFSPETGLFIEEKSRWLNRHRENQNLHLAVAAIAFLWTAAFGVQFLGPGPANPQRAIIYIVIAALLGVGSRSKLVTLITITTSILIVAPSAIYHLSVNEAEGLSDLQTSLMLPLFLCLLTSIFIVPIVLWNGYLAVQGRHLQTLESVREREVIRFQNQIYSMAMQATSGFAAPLHLQPIASNSQFRSGVLMREDILRRELIRVDIGESTSAPDLKPLDETRNNVLMRSALASCLKSASYDLRLGPQVIASGQEDCEVSVLSKATDVVIIEPFGTMLFSTLEVVDIPPDVVGRFDLRIEHALHGLMLQVGTQVEPGYRGRLFGILLNTSSERQAIRYQDRLLTIEFHLTTNPSPNTSTKEVYSLVEFLALYKYNVADMTRPNIIQELRDDVDKCLTKLGARIEDRRKNWQFTVAIASLVLATSFNIYKAVHDYIAESSKDQAPIRASVGNRENR